jgi:hypothetical protein
MATNTTNINLVKQEENEYYDINITNSNLDLIDNAIQDMKNKVDSLELTASNVTMSDGSTVEDTVSANKTSILNLQNELLVNKSILQNNINAIREVL